MKPKTDFTSRSLDWSE